MKFQLARQIVHFPWKINETNYRSFESLNRNNRLDKLQVLIHVYSIFSQTDLLLKIRHKRHHSLSFEHGLNNFSPFYLVNPVDCKTVVIFANASDGQYSNKRSEANKPCGRVRLSRALHSRITLTALRAFRKRLFCSLRSPMLPILVCSRVAVLKQPCKVCFRREIWLNC